MRRPVAVLLAPLLLAGCATAAADTARPATPGTSRSLSAVAPAATPLAAARPGPLAAVRGRVIVLDPGHNGGNAANPRIINRLVDAVTEMKPCDTTGTATVRGYPEHAFTWDVTLRLAAKLRAAGAVVVLTRPNDRGVGPCITQRAAIGNRARAAVALSIHADGAPATARGFHVLQPANVGPNARMVPASLRLAVDVRDAMRRSSGMPVANYVGRSGLVTRRDLGGLNLSTVPKVFVECGNMKNGRDAGLMAAAAGRQRIADALALGLAAYLARR